MNIISRRLLCFSFTEVLFLSDDGAGDGDGGESAMLVDGLILAALKCNSAMLREALGRDAIVAGFCGCTLAHLVRALENGTRDPAPPNAERYRRFPLKR